MREAFDFEADIGSSGSASESSADYEFIINVFCAFSISVASSPYFCFK